MNAVLTTPARYLRAFILDADRVYYSNPVVVEVLYSEVATRLLFVRDHGTGRVFPVDPKNITWGQA